MSEVILIGNDNLLQLDGLTDETDSTYVNSATVVCTVKTTAGVDVTGMSWPLTLSYVSGSNGKYQGILTNSLVLSGREKYIAHIDVSLGADLVMHRELELVAKVNR